MASTLPTTLSPQLRVSLSSLSFLFVLMGQSIAVSLAGLELTMQVGLELKDPSALVSMPFSLKRFEAKHCGARL